MKMNTSLLAAFSLVFFCSLPLIALAENSDSPQSGTTDELKSYSTPMETPDMTTVNPSPREPETAAPENSPVLTDPTQQPETEPAAPSPLQDLQPPDQDAQQPAT
ncbi:MAG: hypothetical protein VB050_09330 [Geobacteraceae bacterium]|nr:hypothetical protein [Geobacteraceae bacterium]